MKSQGIKLLTIAFGLTAFGTSAHAYIDRWQLKGNGDQIVATDCGDCEEDLGIIIACQGQGLPAKVTVNGAASQFGQNGANAPISFNVSGQNFTRRATTVEFGLIGFTPEFNLQPNDPLIEALQGGNQAFVSFNQQQSVLNLNGSRDALNIFKTHCGWNQQAGLNQQQGGGQQQPQLPIFNQPQVGQDAQQPTLPAFNPQQPQVGQGTRQPTLPIFEPQPQGGNGQQQVQQPTLPAFNQAQGGGQQQPQLPLFNQPQGSGQQNTPFGVQPGEAFTQPNQEGLLWYTTSYGTGTSTATRELLYAIPQSDAVVMIANCNVSNPSVYRARFSIHYGNARDGDFVNVGFNFGNQQQLFRPGFVYEQSSESAGVELLLSPQDQLWSQLTSAQSMSIGVQGQPSVTIPGAAHVVRDFLAKCG